MSDPRDEDEGENNEKRSIQWSRKAGIVALVGALVNIVDGFGADTVGGRIGSFVAGAVLALVGWLFLHDW